MTRLFSIGFEFNDLLEVSQIVGTSPTIITSPTHSGSYAVSSLSSQTLRWNLPSPLTEFYVRLYVNYTVITSDATLFVWNNSNDGVGNGNQGNIAFSNTSGKVFKAFVTDVTGVSSLVGTGSVVISAETWYRIEIYVKIATVGGRIIVRVATGEGPPTTDIDFTGNTLQYQPGTLINSNNLQIGGNSTDIPRFDDIAINDINGITDNSWPGPEGFFALIPNGAGALTQITNVVGAATHWQAVDEDPPNGLTDYIWGDDIDLNNVDLYDLTNFTPGNGGIQRVIVDSRMASDVAGGTIQLALRTQSTNYFSGTKTLTTSFIRYINEYLTNPNTGVAWTVADLQALQVGEKIV